MKIQANHNFTQTNPRTKQRQNVAFGAMSFAELERLSRLRTRPALSAYLEKFNGALREMFQSYGRLITSRAEENSPAQQSLKARIERFLEKESAKLFGAPGEGRTPLYSQGSNASKQAYLDGKRAYYFGLPGTSDTKKTDAILTLTRPEGESRIVLDVQNCSSKSSAAEQLFLMMSSDSNRLFKQGSNQLMADERGLILDGRYAGLPRALEYLDAKAERLNRIKAAEDSARNFVSGII